MTTYEYETDGMAPYGDMSLTKWLNHRGADGWKLVSIDREVQAHNREVYYRVIWMREKRHDGDKSA